MDGLLQPLLRFRPQFVALLCFFLLVCFSSRGADAALQFDVFIGHDNILVHNSWTPVMLEVKNDGPAIKGVIEISGDLGQGQVVRTPIDLPTGTLKRLQVPVFPSRRVYAFNARLLDDRGRVRAEQTGLRPRKSISNQAPLLGAFPRTAGGLPSILLPERGTTGDLQPSVARLQPAIFPDNPILLEGLTAIYLNSERLADFSDAQAKALRSWIYAGGHLVLAVEQVSDVTAASWLKDLLPCEIGQIRPLEQHQGFQDWIVSRRSEGPLGSDESASIDLTFEAAPMLVAGAKLKSGRVLAGSEESPLLVQGSRGWGKISVLLASPEREPMRSWKNLPTFWTRLVPVPPHLYARSDQNQGGWSTDGIFGALIDSRQVNKLPLGWLILLLCVYLVVIGPLDRYWLKRLGKPMLTWITFPCYVVAFSFIIYLIGYKLRSGESELNELTVVDVLSNTELVGVKGRSFLSIYSPSNERYPVKSRQQHAAIRSEAAGNWGGSQADDNSRVLQAGDNYEADLFVPVWDSQLFVSDWWNASVPPVTCAIVGDSGRAEVVFQNRTSRELTHVCLVHQGSLYRLQNIPAGQTSRQPLGQAQPLESFLNKHNHQFYAAVTSRNRAFGVSESARLSNPPETLVAVSLLSLFRPEQPYMRFESPSGTNLEKALGAGPLLFAYSSDFSPLAPLHQFTPKRLNRNTFWRIAVEAR